MRPRASKVWRLAQATHRATNGAPSRSHLTWLSILSTKDSISQALNGAHLWIHPGTYRTCRTWCDGLPDLGCSTRTF
jgi:hypothetical protein